MDDGLVLLILCSSHLKTQLHIQHESLSSTPLFSHNGYRCHQ